MARDDRFSYALVADPGVALHLGSGHSRNGPPAGNFDLEAQLVAGADRLAELGTIDSSKDHNLVAAVFDFGQQQCASSLRDSFDDQYPRHDRQTGKMPIEEWFVDGDVLDGDNSFFSLEFQYPVDQQ